MATLQIKNKYEVSLANFIEITAKEAWEILNEIRAVPNTLFVIEATPHYDPQFLLKSSDEKIEMIVAEDLVTRWYKGDFSVFIKVVTSMKAGSDKIPLRVKKKKAEPKPAKVDKPEEKDDNSET